jgi:hypothetical protein
MAAARESKDWIRMITFIFSPVMDAAILFLSRRAIPFPCFLKSSFETWASHGRSWARRVEVILLFVSVTARFFDCGLFTAGLKPCPFKENDLWSLDRALRDAQVSFANLVLVSWLLVCLGLLVRCRGCGGMQVLRLYFVSLRMTVFDRSSFAFAKLLRLNEHFGALRLWLTHAGC